MSITPLHAAKKALRKSMTKTLRDLTQAEVQSQSEAIVARVVALPAFKSAKTISCFLSMPTAEVQTAALIANILADNAKKLFVPTLATNEGRMDFVRLYGEEDLQTLPAGLWGIPQPTAQWKSEKRQSVSDASCEDLDLIITPVHPFHQPLAGVAFDSCLSRLGHGKGHYDRFISTYAAKRPRPLLVALALQQQLLEAGQVPVTEYDEKVDMVVTPNAIITREEPVME